jgi:putative peptide zinc metalloprotease protein
VQEGGQTQYILEDPVRHTFYRLGVEEYLLVSRLNQAVTIDELLLSVARDGETRLSSEQALSIINWLRARQLLQSDDGAPLTQALEQEAAQINLRRFSRLNIITFKLPCLNPDPFLERLGHWLSWLTGPLVFAAWSLLACAALWVLFLRWQEFTTQAQGFLGAGNLVLIWCIWFALKILHELFHALVCCRYGGRVYEAGFLVILFMPMTYVNATSSWTFPSRWQRIHVAVAGMFIELGVAWAAILIWAQQPDTATGFIAHNTVIVAGVSSLLFNANPLMRFDGYYVLSDLLRIPNLNAQGMRYVKELAASWFLGLPSVGGGGESDRHFVKVYGVCVYVWRIMVVFSMGYVACKLAGGIGVLITIGATLVWVGLPLYQFCKRLPQYQQQNPVVLWYLGKRILLTGLLTAMALYFVGWESRIQVPAVVEYEHQLSVRAVAGGFVEKILVTDGQQVAAGDLLLILENSELRHSYREVKLQIAQLELRSRLATSVGKQTDLQILQGQRSALEEKLLALEEDIAALRITAPGDGVVVAAHLDILEGSYLARGQDVLWIVTPDQLHIVGMVPQDDIDLLRTLVGKAIDIDMRTAGIGRFPGTLQRVAPTAIKDLAHPALAAIHGGPLDVKQLALSAGGKEMEQHYRLELFSPCFTVEVAIPPGKIIRLKDGQIATLHARGGRVTLGSLLFKWGRNWLIRKDNALDGQG